MTNWYGTLLDGRYISSMFGRTALHELARRIGAYVVMSWSGCPPECVSEDRIVRDEI